MHFKNINNKPLHQRKFSWKPHTPSNEVAIAKFTTKRNFLGSSFPDNPNRATANFIYGRDPLYRVNFTTPTKKLL